MNFKGVVWVFLKWGCMRWNNSPYQQVAVVCIHHSKREIGRPRMADIQAVVLIRTWNKAAFADHFQTTLTHHLASLQMTMWLWKYPCIVVFRSDEDEKWEEPSVFSLLTFYSLACFPHVRFSSRALIRLSRTANQSDFSHRRRFIMLNLPKIPQTQAD